MNDDYTFLPLAEALPRDLHALSQWYAHPVQVTQERFLATLVADSERFAERARQEAPLPDNVVRLSTYRLKKKGS
ncbi:hypothetical protein [Dyella sp. GSA-30]|uniref:hypothetical protein n=1 Tax=Dyella sp. GSA-30 TaxID=2994496 RepID=UPI002492B348|nr:hypothetical protein [Dyella sp. GSA-30]BDU19146.1 hypothetical protein DYGSA30_06030 [Dyella sp. GSA-30]